MRYLSMRFPGGKFKAVTFSYDDGCRADIHTAEIFNRYGMKGTFNINSGFMAKEEGAFHLTPEEIQKHLIDPGHEIAIHGAHHCAPGLCRPLDAMQDALFCRRELESTFGRIVRGMAYPDSGIRVFQEGMDYAAVKRYLQELNIVYARSLGADNSSFRMPQDFHAWLPTAHHDNPKIMEYIEKFKAEKEEDFSITSRHPRLFYIWGHSYEFDKKNNWEHLEEICQALAGDEDVYYATNMEIWEYTDAYNRLVFSADNSKVYNPSLTPVWFNYDKTRFCVAPGETIVVE